jgi:hypothetical protein
MAIVETNHVHDPEIIRVVSGLIVPTRLLSHQEIPFKVSQLFWVTRGENSVAIKVVVFTPYTTWE